ncbi:MAG: hypothetical protein HY902_08685, partial [Deltaproteobacteria bacterium]|nr:hypothetical protein [Deltaproteobacteria bacterium]
KIPTAGQAHCDLQALETAFAVNSFLLLLGQATQVAPLLARDAHQGALLLYFSRPVLRSHYLLARLAAATGIGSLLVALGTSLVALAAGVLVRNPSAAPLAMGGLVLGSLTLSWILQAAYGRQGLARALDLHHALQAPWFLTTWLLQPSAPPKPMLQVMLLGLVIWLALAALGWWLLQRFLRNPPLGKGRA